MDSEVSILRSGTTVFSTVSPSLDGDEAEGEIADGAILEAQTFSGVEELRSGTTT